MAVRELLLEAVGQKGLTTNFRIDKFDSEVQRKKTKAVVPFSIKLRIMPTNNIQS